MTCFTFYYFNRYYKIKKIETELLTYSSQKQTLVVNCLRPFNISNLKIIKFFIFNIEFYKLQESFNK